MVVKIAFPEPSSKEVAMGRYLWKADEMQRNLIVQIKVALVFLSLLALSRISSASSAPLRSYSPALRRYPYLTDILGSYWLPWYNNVDLRTQLRLAVP